jgi:DNA polymerase
LACENITQAAANDLLRYALRECEAKGLDVELHVHDEIVISVPEDQAEVSKVQLEAIMCTPPNWASGIPLNAESKAMVRYGK